MNAKPMILGLAFALLLSSTGHAKQGDPPLRTRQFDLRMSQWMAAPAQTRVDYITGVLAVLTRLELACPTKFTANDLATMLRARLNANKTAATSKFVVGVLEVLVHEYGCSLDTSSLELITLYK